MSTQDRFPMFEDPGETVAFVPTRQAGLARLEQFATRTGQHYARQRNYDFGPDKRSNVSALSPWIRHRLITEEDVLRATLARHSVSGAEKFVQEVFWRTYFKGWMEQRPSVWTAYQDEVHRALDNAEQPDDYEDAIAGRTGIACFDHWAKELIRTGYLHNHARMWFASIWIFTLRLPWALGADFFLRHLIDGDPASNTLGWRWVAGLHTKGKTYLARASNIEKYTNGQFNPHGQLATVADPLTEQMEHPLVPMKSKTCAPAGDALLLITEDDCHIETELATAPVARLGLATTQGRSPLPIGDLALSFAASAVGDQIGSSPENWAARIIAAAEAAGTNTVVTGYAPVGPVATQLDQVELADAGITLHQISRDYDRLAWPYATKGFFGLKKKIPQLLTELSLA